MMHERNNWVAQTEERERNDRLGTTLIDMDRKWVAGEKNDSVLLNVWLLADLIAGLFSQSHRHADLEQRVAYLESYAPQPPTPVEMPAEVSVPASVSTPVLQAEVKRLEGELDRAERILSKSFVKVERLEGELDAANAEIKRLDDRAVALTEEADRYQREAIAARAARRAAESELAAAQHLEKHWKTNHEFCFAQRQELVEAIYQALDDVAMWSQVKRILRNAVANYSRPSGRPSHPGSELAAANAEIKRLEGELDRAERSRSRR